MSFFFIEYMIYIILIVTVMFSLLRVFKPSFSNVHLNDISNFANFDFKFSFNNPFTTLKIKNNKSDESLFTLIWSTTLLR